MIKEEKDGAEREESNVKNGEDEEYCQTKTPEVENHVLEKSIVEEGEFSYHDISISIIPN